MIGNDIIDLKLASIQSNWKRKGFLDKVFTKHEQELIFDSINPFKMVWTLWSMKESAYKIYVQKHNNRFFAPKKIQCQLTSKTNGLVIIYNEEYITSSVFDANFIYTTATLNNDRSFINNHFKITNDSYSIQHYECYERLILVLIEKLGIQKQGIYIKKNKLGVPKIYQDAKQLKPSFSITHHGNYGGYSILNE